MDAPVHHIDLAPLIAGGPDHPDGRAVIEAFDRAGRDSGFILLSGHGVDSALIDGAIDAWQRYFDLPLEEKLAHVPATTDANTGYTPFTSQALAYTSGEATPPDLMEGYSIGRDDAVGDFYDEHREWFQPNIWPDAPADLRDANDALELELRRVADVVLRAMALALDLPEDWLVERNERAVITLRPNHYPSPAADAPEDGQQRLGAHTDYGVMTLLVADPVPGLQVLRGGRWHDFTPPHGTILCNIGDMLSMWTNDRWTSTMHRVVAPEPGAGRRRSIARFLDGDPSVELAPIPSCVGPGEPARYPTVNAGEWLLAKLIGGAQGAPVDLPDGGLTGATHR
jgi:isopenicillin N synthase-like dioxygenase